MKNIFYALIILILLLASCKPEKSKQSDFISDYQQFILTPPPPASPRINGPRVYGIRPGSPLLYRIPCTGNRPMVFTATDIPEGLILDSLSGIITGTLKKPGEYPVTFCAVNAIGKDCKTVRIIAGDRIALTPPMGWNSWYIHYDRISDSLMRQAADQMVVSGMADFGYQYVNIDDCWMVKVNSGDEEIGGPARTLEGNILPNKRFPDMNALTDFIHSKGLKAGIYISPGPRTCAGYEGSLNHESQDAMMFASWEFDFLKYDWCSYSEIADGKTLQDYQKPYRIMSTELNKLNRDIVLNLCQYGMADVWKWGGEFGQCWRTTGDLGLEKGDSLPGFYSIGFSNAAFWEYARPGAWNDPDYILIGWVGDANNMGLGTPTKLTPYEQYSYMSMWCLMAAPLIFSGDMGKLDPFTLNVLCNHEVIEIDQDPLGKQARIIKKTEYEFVLAKDLEDGSLAAGIFNLSNKTETLTINWEELGIQESRMIRDLWRQTDLGLSSEKFIAEIPAHGVILIKLIPVR